VCLKELERLSAEGGQKYPRGCFRFLHAVYDLQFVKKMKMKMKIIRTSKSGPVLVLIWAFITLFTADAMNIDVGSTLQRRESPTSWYSMFTRLPKDWYRGANLAIRSENIPTIAGIGGLTYALVRTDNLTWQLTRREYKRSPTAHKLIDAAVILGDGRLNLAVGGAFAAFGFVSDDTRALRTATQTVEAILATGLTVQVLKHITGRQSPIDVARQRHARWRFFPSPKRYYQHQSSYYAFPSGHISTAMATLTVISNNYPDEPWIKPLGYTLEGALGVGLVGKGMHWYSDLPLGLALGYWFGRATAAPEPPMTSKGNTNAAVRMSLVPSVGSRGGRLSLAVAF
jgi:hypothetical protein